MSGRLYAWTSETRAGRACIRFHIARALEQKRWAATVTDEWKRAASTVSLDMAERYSSQSVRTLARAGLEYHRLRAHVGLATDGRNWDRPAHKLWQALADPTPRLISFYSFDEGGYIVGRNLDAMGEPVARFRNGADAAEYVRAQEARPCLES